MGPWGVPGSFRRVVSLQLKYLSKIQKFKTRRPFLIYLEVWIRERISTSRHGLVCFGEHSSNPTCLIEHEICCSAICATDKSILHSSAQIIVQNKHLTTMMSLISLFSALFLLASSADAFTLQQQQSRRGCMKMSANIFDMSSIFTSELFSSPTARHVFYRACAQ